MDRLKREISQKLPFASVEEEAYLNLLRTASVLSEGVHDVLRAAGLSQPQYNVLRILRGARPDGLPGKTIGERMVSREPDVPRLLDRLERDGLITRTRSQTDRRVVMATVTEAGLERLDRLDGPIPQTLLERLSHVKRADLEQLIHLLEVCRDQPLSDSGDK